MGRGRLDGYGAATDASDKRFGAWVILLTLVTTDSDLLLHGPRQRNPPRSHLETELLRDGALPQVQGEERELSGLRGHVERRCEVQAVSAA